MKKKRHSRLLVMIISVAGMITGLVILMYPFLMDCLNDYRNSKAITSMSSVYDRYSENETIIEEQLLEAQRYNRYLSGSTEYTGKVKDYDEQLSFDGAGIMGYLQIPAINLKMLIYHGTEDETLAIGAGHLKGTSLPVGGRSSHCVITAHSGMKSMSAFDNLRKMKEGDRFTVTVLGRTFTYETEKIETVLPYETESLEIVPGEDRLTLVTCTPYGINDHRLLVHGIRVSDTEDPCEAEEGISETEPLSGMWSGAYIRILLAAAAMLIIGVFITAVLVRKRRRKDRK